MTDNFHMNFNYVETHEDIIDILVCGGFFEPGQKLINVHYKAMCNGAYKRWTTEDDEIVWYKFHYDVKSQQLKYWKISKRRP